jgi:hypothetical protein
MPTRCLYGSKTEIIDLHILVISWMSVKLEEETREPTKKTTATSQIIRVHQVHLHSGIELDFCSDVDSQ